MAAAVTLAASAYGAEPANDALRPDVRFVFPAAQFESLAENYPLTDDSASANGASEPLPPPVPPQADGSGPKSYVPERLDLPRTEYALETVPCETSPVTCPSEGETRRGIIEDMDGARAVQYPDNWMWGCGGWPYANGPGLCDDWKVGCRWHVTADGIVMTRDTTNLDALQESMEDPNNFISTGDVGDPTLEQFDRGVGGRVVLMSQVGRCTGWDVQCVYEGVPEWHSSIVYPKQALPELMPPFVIPPDPNTEPPPPFPEGFEQRSLHYTSSMHSAELNAVRLLHPSCRSFFGVRYIKFDDEINDTLDQQRQAPLPGPRSDFIGPAVPPDIEVNDPIGPTHETDRYNLFDLQNDLIGFQLGLLHDTWRVHRRFAFEGFVSGGVYYNKIKYTNQMGISTTQIFADNTRSEDIDDARVDQSTIVNNDVREYGEVAYVTEASLTGVCRLNKCWALRGGYQLLWIANVHLAEAAYLGDENSSGDLLFHGWHFGVECRR